MLGHWLTVVAARWNDNITSESRVQEFGQPEYVFAGYPPWMFYLAAGCCTLFMLVGIPGNLITLAALFRTKKLRNATAVFIMNLSISDLMFCCFNLPLATSTFLHGRWVHGPLVCRLFPLMRYGLVAVSLFTVLAITINRYVMIGHPRLYPKLYKPRYLALMVLATWASGFGALTPTWFGAWGRFGLDLTIGSCSILPDEYKRSPKEFLFILAFVAPCLSIVLCYARIFYIVRKTAMKSRRHDDAASELVRASHGALQSGRRTTEPDSAIGSMSCHATHTSENGTSPHRDSCRLAIPELRVPSPEENELVKMEESNKSPIEQQQQQQQQQLAPERLRRFLSPPSCVLDTELGSDDGASSRSRSTSPAAPVDRRRYGSRLKSLRASESGRMTDKDKKLLKMILVIFTAFVVCYLPITLSRTFRGTAIDSRGLDIAGYILIYMTTCINPIIYVVMSSEYRSAYKNIVLCRSESNNDALGRMSHYHQSRARRPHALSLP